jgi:mRNA-degrading endonuclease RelE of RelBE toxin-antitoxin system
LSAGALRSPCFAPGGRFGWAVMFQVTFSPQALGELKKLDPLAQLTAVEPVGNLRAEDLSHPREPLGRFTRAGKTLYRLRAGELRYYFETQGETVLHVLYILQPHSLEDFLLRNRLPVSEGQLVEQHSKFWKYLETLTK